MMNFNPNATSGWQQWLTQNPITGINGALQPAAGSGGIFASPQINGGVMGEQQQARKDALMAAAAQLLAGSGYSPVRRSFGELVGQAMLAGQQARANALDQSQKRQLMQAQIRNLDESNQRPVIVMGEDGKLRYANPADAIGQQAGSTVQGAEPPASIQEYNLYIAQEQAAGRKPKSFEDWLRTKAAFTPINPSVVTIGNVPTVVQPTRGGPASVTPLNTPQGEVDAAAAKARAEAEAKAAGTSTGEAAGAVSKKAAQADTTLAMLDMAGPLVDIATGSLTGTAADKVAAWFGVSLDGAQANAQLKILHANMMLNMPRMEGPQSDRDVQLYRDAAAQLGDSTVPRDTKKAAITTLRMLQERYKDNARAAAPGAGSAGGAQAGKYTEGQRATNPATGETLEYRNGKWQPVTQ